MNNSRTLTFVQPILGREGIAEYELCILDAEAGLYQLVGGAGAFYLIDSEKIPNYVPLDDLPFDSRVTEPVAALAVITPPNVAGGVATVNLLAPIVLNAKGEAGQVILLGEYPLRKNFS